MSPATLLESGRRVVPHAGLAGYEGAWLFRHGSSWIVSVPERCVEETRARLEPFDEPDLHVAAAVETLFGEDVERTVGPAWWGAMERADFRPAPGGAGRRLDASDRPALERLCDACGPEDWRLGGVSFDDPHVFGSFEGETLAAVAHLRRWIGNVGNPGIVTDPARRGRGHGRAATSALLGWAFAKDWLALYQTLRANEPAVGVARSLGFREFASHVAVRFRKV